MKLVFTPNPYIHKELVVGYEAGILGELLFERQVPFDTDSNIWKYNPVGKITALELDDGTSILAASSFASISIHSILGIGFFLRTRPVGGRCA